MRKREVRVLNETKESTIDKRLALHSFWKHLSTSEKPPRNAEVFRGGDRVQRGRAAVLSDAARGLLLSGEACRQGELIWVGRGSGLVAGAGSLSPPFAGVKIGPAWLLGMGETFFSCRT